MLNLRTQSVNVKRSELIAALKLNLQVHLAQYAEALEDYKAKVIYELEQALEKAKAGTLTEATLHIVKPESHERDFTNVIEMMEMSVDDTINLEGDAFRAYFKNEWSWQRSFEISAASYKMR